MATAATTPSSSAYATADNLIDGGMNKLEGYMRNDERENNQSLMVSTSVASTAGPASTNIIIETIGYGWTVMPGVVTDN